MRHQGRISPIACSHLSSFILSNLFFFFLQKEAFESKLDLAHGLKHFLVLLFFLLLSFLLSSSPSLLLLLTRSRKGAIQEIYDIAPTRLFCHPFRTPFPFPRRWWQATKAFTATLKQTKEEEEEEEREEITISSSFFFFRSFSLSLSFSILGVRKSRADNSTTTGNLHHRK